MEKKVKGMAERRAFDSVAVYNSKYWRARMNFFDIKLSTKLY